MGMAELKQAPNVQCGGQCRIPSKYGFPLLVGKLLLACSCLAVAILGSDDFRVAKCGQGIQTVTMSQYIGSWKHCLVLPLLQTTYCNRKDTSLQGLLPKTRIMKTNQQ